MTPITSINTVDAALEASKTKDQQKSTPTILNRLAHENTDVVYVLGGYLDGATTHAFSLTCKSFNTSKLLSVIFQKKTALVNGLIQKEINQGKLTLTGFLGNKKVQNSIKSLSISFPPTSMETDKNETMLRTLVNAFTELQTLHLDESYPLRPQAISELSKLAKLKVLHYHLEGSNPGNPTFQEIAKCTSLEKLVLSFIPVRISNETIHAFAASSLKELQIRNTQFLAVDFGLLAHIVSLEKLSFFNCTDRDENTQLSDLALLPKLKEIDLRYSGFSIHQVLQFQQIRPDVKIVQ